MIVTIQDAIDRLNAGDNPHDVLSSLLDRNTPKRTVRDLAESMQVSERRARYVAAEANSRHGFGVYVNGGWLFTDCEFERILAEKRPDHAAH